MAQEWTYQLCTLYLCLEECVLDLNTQPTHRPITDHGMASPPSPAEKSVHSQLQSILTNNHHHYRALFYRQPQHSKPETNGSLSLWLISFPLHYLLGPHCQQVLLIASMLSAVLEGSGVPFKGHLESTMCRPHLGPGPPSVPLDDALSPLAPPDALPSFILSQ